MQHVTLRRVVNNDSIECSTPTTGATLLNELGHEWLVLASIQPLNSGRVYRRYRRVQPDGLYDLTVYTELYTPDRQLVATIEPVQEMTYATHQ